MLPHTQLSNIQKDISLCSCSIFTEKAANQQNAQIFLTKNADQCYFFNNSTQPNFKIQLPSNNKLSLRRNKDKRLKENTPTSLSGDSCGNLEKTIAKTDIMTRADSQMIKTFNEFHHLNHYSCFSSYVFQESALQQSKNAFGRYMPYIKNLEENKQNQITASPQSKEKSQVRQKSVSPKRNRSKVKCLTKFEPKEKVKADIQRHTRSQSGQVMSMPNFYSQPRMKSSSLTYNDLDRQVSSIVFKRKTGKKIHYLDQLDFKDTQTINDQSSESISEVISDFSQFGEKGKFSHVVVPKLKWKKFSQMPKFSKPK